MIAWLIRTHRELKRWTSAPDFTSYSCDLMSSSFRRLRARSHRESLVHGKKTVRYVVKRVNDFEASVQRTVRNGKFTSTRILMMLWLPYVAVGRCGVNPNAQRATTQAHLAPNHAVRSVIEAQRQEQTELAAGTEAAGNK
jgi:hypothetical protein